MPGEDSRIALTKAARLLIRSQIAGRARLAVPGSPAPAWSGMLVVGSNGPFSNLKPGGYLLELVGPNGVALKSVPVNLVSGATTAADL